MKLPISWLKEYVDFEDTVEGLCDKLVFSGIEVEGVETVGGAPAGVVAAKVLSVREHPDSDHLHLCVVDYGAAGPLEIVCGAPNVAAGGTYPFAPVGTELPGGFKIEKRKVRGVESCGMLCSERELGLSQDHGGLMVLDDAVAPGTPLSALLGEPETVLELEITPNRPDELCVTGVAREVAALYGTELRLPDASLPEESAEEAAGVVRVEVEDSTDCPRYSARVLRGVKIGPSPDWMKRRLEAAGVRSINNVVDVTNYVMLECGQPLHAFDLRQVGGGKIVVRHPRGGEKIVTLDGVERALEPSMLVICDAEKPLAVAGVMGGEYSGIADDTTDVLLESANFRAAAIRATTKKLGLSSESSYRYMRGVGADAAGTGSRRAARLLCELAGATICKGVVDVWPAPTAPWRVECRMRALRDLLGIEAGADEVAAVFGRLGLTVAANDGETLSVEVPPFRADLTREADLVEEFVRIWGLKKLPPVRTVATVVEGVDDLPYQAMRRLRETLAGMGLQQVMNYSFLSDALLDRFDAAGRDKRVRMANPLTAEHTVMRDALLPQVVENVGLNVSRQVGECAFFETGRVFRLGADGAPAECEHVAAALLGPVGRAPLAKTRPVGEMEMFLWLKGLWTELTAALGLRGAFLKAADRPWGEPGRGMDIVIGGKTAGWLGLLSGKIAAEWRIHEPVGVFEAETAPLLRDVAKLKKLAPPPSFPSVRRDAALVVAGDVRHEAVLKIVKKAAPPELESVELFDVYEGKNLGGKKSLAYAFRYRSATGTLTDEAVNAFQTRINDALKTGLPAEIREG